MFAVLFVISWKLIKSEDMTQISLFESAFGKMNFLLDIMKENGESSTCEID